MDRITLLDSRQPVKSYIKKGEVYPECGRITGTNMKKDAV